MKERMTYGKGLGGAAVNFVAFPGKLRAATSSTATATATSAAARHADSTALKCVSLDSQARRLRAYSVCT